LSISAEIAQPTGSSDPGIVSIAGSAGVGSGDGATDIGGADLVAVNLIYRHTAAYITDSTVAQENTSATDTGLSLDAEDDSQIIAVGAAVAVSNGTAVGAAVGYNGINDTTDAYLNDTQATLAGSLTVTATANATIGSADIGAGVGDDGPAIAGSISINTITDSIEADIENDSTVTVSGSSGATIRAKDNSMIAAIAGGVAGSAGDSPAIGAAIGYNLIGNTIEADVDGSTLVAPDGPVSISAISSPLLIALAVGGAVSSGSSPFTLGGSITVNSVVNTIDAHIPDGAIVAALGDVDVTGAESSQKYVVSGGLALSAGAVAIGASLAFNYMGGGFDVAHPDTYGTRSSNTNAINAYIDAASVKSNTGNINVSTGLVPTAGYNANLDENVQLFTPSDVNT
jgi:hypothetical protein